MDSIRVACALWVVMAHMGGPPLAAGADRSAPTGWAIVALNNNLWVGQAAVIVFFVISGFCIHYPFSRTLLIPSLAGYSARRYIRIGLPLAAAMALAPPLGVKLPLFHDSILWSLAAELVYYTLYPGLLTLRRRGLGWGTMTGIALVAALALAATNPTAKDYPSWGVGLNWLLGLPCWLAGCVLAERTASGRLPDPGPIWAWRAGIWGVSVALSVARFHSPLGYPWTLNAFALLVACWLAREVAYHRNREPAAWLEWAGGWSYSLYLTHLIAAAFLARLRPPNLGPNLNWAMLMAFTLASAYLFYAAIEWPAHMLARMVGGRASGRPAVKHVAAGQVSA